MLKPADVVKSAGFCFSERCLIMSCNSVDCAVIMAAGLGTRMRPVTDSMPKPLVEVAGTPLIETSIRGLLSAGVGNLIVVTGYMADMFEYLPSKYPGVSLVRNPHYMTMNNASSIQAAAGLVRGNCYVCEADLYVADPSVFSPVVDRSAYFGRPVGGNFDDWGFVTDVSGRVTGIKPGGVRSWCDFAMTGVSVWLWSDFSVVLDRIAAMMNEESGRTRFWDEAVDDVISSIDVGIRPVESGSIVEIDTVEELESIRRRFAGPKGFDL